MQYEEAVKIWGAGLLCCYTCNRNDRARQDRGKAKTETVTVTFDFNQGYACCGGTNPDCYCSFAESPSANLVITGKCECGMLMNYSLNAEDFDFVRTLGEIVDAGEGRLSE